MVAVLSSPRFLFRLEETSAAPSRSSRREEALTKKSAIRNPQSEIDQSLLTSAATSQFVDEYSLSARLSYFLWSTMPDAELFGLAARGELRKNLVSEIKRMLDDPRSQAFIENFTGQWLQTRDIDGIDINTRAILARDAGEQRDFARRGQRFRELIGIPEAKRTPEEKAELQQMFERRRRFNNRPQFELDRDLRDA